MTRALVIFALLLVASSATANAVMRTLPASTGDSAGEIAGPTPLPPSLVPLSRGDVRAALERARPELVLCLDTPPGGVESSEPPRALRAGTVRVRLSAEEGLTVRARTRPRRAEAELCLDTVTRRHVTPLLERRLRRPVSVTFSVARPR